MPGRQSPKAPPTAGSGMSSPVVSDALLALARSQPPLEPAAEVVEVGIDDRDNDKREERRSNQSADHGARHRCAEVAPFAERERDEPT
jgi:hypothetical protein